MDQSNLGKEFFISIFTVVFTIISIIIFLSYGANLLFYILVLITIIVGVINAWLINKKGTAEQLLIEKHKKAEKVNKSKQKSK